MQASGFFNDTSVYKWTKDFEHDNQIKMKAAAKQFLLWSDDKLGKNPDFKWKLQSPFGESVGFATQNMMLLLIIMARQVQENDRCIDAFKKSLCDNKIWSYIQLKYHFLWLFF